MKKDGKRRKRLRLASETLRALEPAAVLGAVTGAGFSPDNSWCITLCVPPAGCG